MSKGKILWSSLYQGCRNVLIVDAVQSGLTRVAVGKLYSISAERVREIYNLITRLRRNYPGMYGEGIDDDISAPSTPEEATLMNKAASYYDSRG